MAFSLNGLQPANIEEPFAFRTLQLVTKSYFYSKRALSLSIFLLNSNITSYNGKWRLMKNKSMIAYVIQGDEYGR